MYTNYKRLKTTPRAHGRACPHPPNRGKHHSHPRARLCVCMSCVYVYMCVCLSVCVSGQYFGILFLGYFKIHVYRSEIYTGYL